MNVIQRLACADNDTIQRILGNNDRHPCFTGKQLVQVAQQCAATGQHNAPVHDVGCQLRRTFLKRHFYSFDNRIYCIRQRFTNLI
ncbi:hypothetical protein D3C80_1883680 [compost metagenome]